MRLQSLPSKFADVANNEWIKKENAAELTMDRELGVEVFVNNEDGQVFNFIETIKNKVSSTSFQVICPSTFTETTLEKTVSVGVCVGSMVPARVFSSTDEEDLQTKLKELDLDLGKIFDFKTKPLTVTKIVCQDLSETGKSAKITLKLHAILTHPIVDEFVRVMPRSYNDLTVYPLSLEIGTFTLKPSFSKIAAGNTHHRSVKSYLQSACKNLFNPSKSYEILQPEVKLYLMFKSPYRSIEFKQKQGATDPAILTMTLIDSQITAGTMPPKGTKEDVALEMLSNQLKTGLGGIMRTIHWANLIGRLKVNPCKLLDLLEEKSVLERTDREKFSAFFNDGDWKIGIAKMKPETEAAVLDFENKDEGARSLLNLTRTRADAMPLYDDEDDGGAAGDRHATLHLGGEAPNSSIVSQIMRDISFTMNITGNGAGEDTEDGNAHTPSVRCGVRSSDGADSLASHTPTRLDFNPRCIDNLYSPEIQIEAEMQSVVSGFNESEPGESDLIAKEVVNEMLVKVGDTKKTLTNLPAAAATEWRENPVIPKTPVSTRFCGLNSTLSHFNIPTTEDNSDTSEKSSVSSIDSLTDIDPLDTEVIQALCTKTEGMAFANRDAWVTILNVLENYQTRKHKHKIACPCYECKHQTIAKKIELLKNTDIYETVTLNEGQTDEKTIRIVSKQYTNGLDRVIMEQLQNLHKREAAKPQVKSNPDFIFALKIIMQTWGHCLEQLQEIDLLKELMVSSAKDKVTSLEIDEAKFKIDTLKRQKEAISKVLLATTKLKKAGNKAQQEFLKNIEENPNAFQNALDSLSAKETDKNEVEKLNLLNENLKAEVKALRSATQNYFQVEESKNVLQRKAENLEKRVQDLLASEKDLAERVSDLESEKAKRAAMAQLTKTFKSTSVDTQSFDLEEEEKLNTKKEKELRARQKLIETKEKELEEDRKKLESDKNTLNAVKETLERTVREEEERINSKVGHLPIVLEANQRATDYLNKQKSAIAENAEVIKKLEEADVSAVYFPNIDNPKTDKLSASFKEKLNNDDTIKTGILNLSETLLKEGLINPLLANTAATPAESNMRPSESSTPAECRANLDNKLAEEEDISAASASTSAM